MLRVILIFTLVSLCMHGHAQAESRIKVGVSLPLTGPAASYGLDMKNSIEFANSYLFKDRYQLVFEDDACDGKTAVSAAKKLLEVDKVSYMLGYACSGALLSAAPLLDRAKILTIAAGASAPAISASGDYIFRTWPSDEGMAQLMFDQISKDHSSFAVISEQTDWAQAMKQGILRRAQDSSGIRIQTEDFLSSDMDLRSMLLRAVSKHPSALIINSQSESKFLDVLQKLRQLAPELPVYGAYFPSSPSFLEMAKDLAEGIHFFDISVKLEDLSSEGRSVIDAYINRYGNPRFSIFFVIANIESFGALNAAITSKTEPREYLYKNQFTGYWGDWRFDSNGDIRGLQPSFGIIRNAKPEYSVAQR